MTKVKLPEGILQLTALDLFAGAGGISCGFEWAGGTVVGGVEIDPFAASTFAANHPRAKIWTEDIRTLSPTDLLAETGPIDVILGGPMCQGVSQRGPRDPHDERNFAFWAFAHFVREIQPRFFIMENVPAVASDVHNRLLAIEVFKELESLGYHLAADVVNAAWLGVPQLRHRLVVMGSLEARPHFPPIVGEGIAGVLPEEAFVTVSDAIMDLPPVEAGGGWDETEYPAAPHTCSEYASLMRVGATRLWNHWNSATDEVNLSRIRHVREGGNWHDIPLELLPERFAYVRMSDHTTTYRRLDRSHPAHTVTTECGNVTSGAFTHPVQDRAITVREAARLQSFPDRFRFCGPRGSQYRQVGNAVPPLAAKQLIEHLVEGRAGYPGRLTADVLSRYPDGRLPFTLAPRYKPLFGLTPGSQARREERPQALALDV